MEEKTISEIIESDVMKKRSIDEIIESGVVTPQDRYLIYYDILMLLHSAKIKVQNEKMSIKVNILITEGIIRGLDIAKEMLIKYFWD